MGDTMTEYSNKDLQESAHRHLWMHFTRMSYDTHQEIPVIVRGEGVWVYDQHGKRYLDGLSGLFTSQLGHGRMELVEAGAEQAAKLAYFPVWSYAHPKAVELAEKIADLAPGDINRIFFTTGGLRGRRVGLEAGPPVLQADRPARAVQGHQPRHRLPRRHDGRPVDHRRHRDPKRPFEPLVPGAIKVPNTNFYRAPYFGDDEEAFGRWAADDIEQAILGRGPRDGGRRLPGAGAELRRLLPPASRLLPAGPRDLRPLRRPARLRRGHLRLRPARPLLRLRALRLRARHDHLAKGLTSGYSPLGALAVSDRLIEPFLAGPSFLHGITFAGHPVSSAAVALANIDVFEKEGILGQRARARGRVPASLETLRDLPIVGDVRGDGYFYGIEMVKDKDTKETFNDDEAERLLRGFLSPALFESGLDLPGRRPGRPGDPARPAAHLRSRGVRLHRRPPAARPDEAWKQI